MDITGIRVGIDASPSKQGETAFNASLDSMHAKAATVTQQIKGYFSGMGSGVTFDGSSFKRGLEEIQSTAGTVTSQIKAYFAGVGGALGGLKDQIFSLRGVIEGALAGVGLERLVEHIAHIQDLKNALFVLTGTADGAAKSFEFLVDVGNALGLRAEDMAAKFTRFAIATRGTQLEGERTKLIFEAVAVAARAMGGAEQVDAMLQSFIMLMSRANVEGTMMIRMLARQIPDAAGIAARAFGVTKEKLTDMLKGNVGSEEFVGKFAVQMLKEFTPAAARAADGISAWKERVMNAFDEVVERIGQSSFGDKIKGALQDMVNLLSSDQFLTAVEKFGTVLAEGVQIFGKALLFAADHTRLLVAAMTVFLGLEMLQYVANVTKAILLLKDALLGAAVAQGALNTAEGEGAISGGIKAVAGSAGFGAFLDEAAVGTGGSWD